MAEKADRNLTKRLKTMDLFRESEREKAMHNLVITIKIILSLFIRNIYLNIDNNLKV